MNTHLRGFRGIALGSVIGVAMWVVIILLLWLIVAEVSAAPDPSRTPNLPRCFYRGDCKRSSERPIKLTPEEQQASVRAPARIDNDLSHYLDADYLAIGVGLILGIVALGLISSALRSVDRVKANYNEQRQIALDAIDLAEQYERQIKGRKS